MAAEHARVHTLQEGSLLVSDDRGRVDRDLVHSTLARMYWCEGIPRQVVDRSIDHSLCFGAYDLDRPGAPQVGFARIISDLATFAYLADVFVIEPWRGRGVSKAIMRCIGGHPDLRGLRRWMLLTRDAHGLYQQFGFGPAARPDRVMERLDPDVYRRPPAGGAPQ